MDNHADYWFVYFVGYLCGWVARICFARHESNELLAKMKRNMVCREDDESDEAFAERLNKAMFYFKVD